MKEPGFLCKFARIFSAGRAYGDLEKNHKSGERAGIGGVVFYWVDHNGCWVAIQFGNTLRYGLHWIQSAHLQRKCVSLENILL